jgi:hypothetical protein
MFRDMDGRGQRLLAHTKAAARAVRNATAYVWTRSSAAVAGAVAAWNGVDQAERRRLRHHLITLLAAAAATLATAATGLAPAGPLMLADLVIVGTAWFFGFSGGLVAALTVVLVGRVAAMSGVGVPIPTWLSLIVLVKGLLLAIATAAIAMRVRADDEELMDRERSIDGLRTEVRNLQHELAATRTTSSETHAAMSQEAEEARTQLTSLQSVTDPSLNTLQGNAEILTTLLNRLRSAIEADGVALCSIEGRSGRIFSASDGLTPLGAVRKSLPDFRDYQARRATLIHNDPERVADGSLCGWPADVTSLIAVPVFQNGRLQLVVETANRQARRSTEWELALIQVVAERAAGLLRQESYGAVA